LDKIHQHMLK